MLHQVALALCWLQHGVHPYPLPTSRRLSAKLATEWTCFRTDRSHRRTKRVNDKGTLCIRREGSTSSMSENTLPR